MQVARYDCELFNRSVVAAFGCSEFEAITYFNSLHDDDFNFNMFNDGTRGWCQEGGGDIYIWAKNSPAVLIHEFVHAACRLCDLIGTARDDEIIARLVEQMKLKIMDELPECEADWRDKGQRKYFVLYDSIDGDWFYSSKTTANSIGVVCGPEEFAITACEMLNDGRLKL